MFGFHILPSTLTFLAVSPLQMVMTDGTNTNSLEILDFIAISVTFAAIVIAFIADK